MSFRSFILHNFWLKLFSLLLATLIWFAIHFWIESGNPQPQSPIINPGAPQFYRIPVRLLMQPGDKRMFKVEPDQVIVKVSGEAAVLRDLSPDEIYVFVDLRTVRSARDTNQQVKLDIPNGVALMDVVPRSVIVEEVSP